MPVKSYVQEWIAHLSAILSVMLLTFWVTDRFNTAMAFINHPMTKRLLFAYALITAALAILLLLYRTRALFPLLLGVSIPSLLLSAGTVTLLLLDHFFPRLLLFVGELGKGYLLGVVLCGLALALFSIGYFRKAVST